MDRRLKILLSSNNVQNALEIAEKNIDIINSKITNLTIQEKIAFISLVFEMLTKSLSPAYCIAILEKIKFDLLMENKMNAKLI